MKIYTKILTALFTGLIVLFVTGNLYAQDVDINTLIQEAREAGIEQTAITELQNRARERNVTDQQLGAILNSAIQMAEENLPADAAIQKALEGLSKGVPGQRIVPVIDQVYKSMGQATAIVDPWVNKPEVQKMIDRPGQSMQKEQFRNELAKATSKSMIQNTPPDAVNGILSEIGTESILSNARPSDIIAALSILSDLPSTAERPEVSGTFIVRALKGGFRADDLQKLPSAIKMAQQRSELPAASVIEGVAEQMQGGIPARQILQNLFKGNVGGGPPGNIPKGLDGRPDRGNNNGGTG